MKQIKWLALLLAFAMLLGLCACGSNPEPAAEEPAAAPAEESAASEEKAEEASAAEPAAEEAADEADAGYTGESFVIYMASDGVETADQNAPMVHFRDAIAEKSGGAVTVEVSWGGTEYDNAGIWEGVSTNLLNMDIALMNKHASDAPMMMWGYMPYSSTAQESIDQTNWLLFENEETASIISDYLSSFNMTLLGNSCDGAPSFITTFEWDGLDDLVSKCSSFGTMNTAKYQAIGLNCVACPAPQNYDDLSRGIVDGVSAPLATALTNSLYEVAPYATVDGQYTSAVLILANSDFWNGLSPEAQALVQECVDETSAFSAEYITQSTQKAAATWEENTGNPVVFLDEEQGVALWAQSLAAIAENAKSSAAGTAYEDNMRTLLEAWVDYQEEYHGIDIDWEW